MVTRHPNHRDPASLPAELRRVTVPPAVRSWIERETGSRVVRWRRLPGASSSAVHAVRLDGGRVVVLRRWSWPWIFTDEPVIARRELDALALAEGAGLPAPRVISADPDGDQVGDGVPVLLMTRLAGRAVAAPDLRALAETAATIHDVVAAGFGHEFFRWCIDALAAPPPTAGDPGLWERALQLRADAMPRYGSGFIHRDYHPGNVLWSRGRLTGVVDWALACRGPWECDVATCRSNLRDWAGPAAAGEFLAAYMAITGRAYDPYWDLNYFLENDADHWTPAQVRRDEPFLREIVAAMG